MTMILLVIFRSYIRRHHLMSSVGGYIVGILNAVQIMVFDAIYSNVARMLNNWGKQDSLFRRELKLKQLQSS